MPPLSPRHFARGRRQVKFARELSRSPSPAALPRVKLCKLTGLARRGDAQGIARLVKLLPPNHLDARDDSGRTALIYAAAGGHSDAVCELLKAGADVNDCSEHKQRKAYGVVLQSRLTPLLAAYRNDKLETVKLLVRSKADPNLGTVNGFSPLSFACYRGDIALAQLLICNRADVNKTPKEGSGATALTVGCSNGDRDVATLLLEHKADPNKPDKDGDTPLHSAVSRSHVDGTSLVALLIEARADVQKSDLFATMGKRAEAGTALTKAARHREVLTVKILLEAKADPDGADPCGETPLLTAIRHGHAKTVQLLLDSRANVNRPGREGTAAEGSYPLCAACFTGRQDIAESLLLARARLDVQSSGIPPLIWACGRGDIDVVKLLMRHCAASAFVVSSPPGGASSETSPHSSLWGRVTPERVARERGHHAIADWLKAVRGFTAVHWACETRDTARLTALLREDEADVFVRAGSPRRRGGTLRRSPLDVASSAGWPIGSPVCTETLRLIRAATSPWSRTTNTVWPRSFRAAATVVFMVAQRLRRDASTGCGCTSKGELATLTPELWELVLSFCSRDWFLLCPRSYYKMQSIDANANP